MLYKYVKECVIHVKIKKNVCNYPITLATSTLILSSYILNLCWLHSFKLQTFGKMLYLKCL
jgi:hypothetical protein